MHQKVLVTGATGMVGRAVVPALLARGYSVRVLTRHKTTVAWNNVDIVEGDMTDQSAVERAVSGMDAVIHLAAAKNDEKDSEAVNVGGAKNLRSAAEKYQVRRIINISTQSAKLPKKGLYGRTKEEADAILQASAVPVTTLLCSVVYGEKHDGIFGSILGFSALPVLPVIGPGTVHFRPIHRDDLASIIIEALEKNTLRATSYDIGGPDNVSFDELADKILETQHLTRRHAHIPVSIAMVLTKLFSFLPHPPVTVSNVLGSMYDVPMDLSAFERDFQARPRSISDGLRALIAPIFDDAQLEAQALLRYVLPIQWEPDSLIIERYLTALDRHAVPRTPTLDVRVRKSPLLLSIVDTALLYDAHCVLRQKLLIAAAVAECTGVSAPYLLPKDRSVIAVIFSLSGIAIACALKNILALPLYLMPSFLSRNAGRS